VFDDTADMAAVAAGVSRFLAVESCGQCTPCKLDGLRIAELLAAVGGSRAHAADLDELRRRLTTVADGARCSLATQQQVVATSVLDQFPGDVEAHVEGRAPAAEPVLVAELLDIAGGVAHADEHHRAKQPDWTFNETDSGQFPAARLGEHRTPEHLDE